MDWGILSNKKEKQEEFLFYLKEWNKVHNLTGIKDFSLWWSHHIQDSLSTLEYLNNGSVADIGTGAGIPGIPIAIESENRDVYLVESIKKKCGFLHFVKEKMKLENINIINDRAENIKDIKVDNVISRALGSLAYFYRVSSHLLKKNGKIISMKGTVPEQEIDEIKKQCAISIEKLKIPSFNRNLIIFSPK